MGAKAAKLKNRDVPAHNPLVNNDLIRMHYFGDREETPETQIRQENHFTIINKNGVVDNGKTLVGLRKRNHMNKIFFIRRKPKRYGGQQDVISDNASDYSDMQKYNRDNRSDFSHSENLEPPDHQFNESSNHIFDSQIIGEDQKMIDQDDKSEMSMDSDYNNLKQHPEEDGKIILSDRKMDKSPREEQESREPGPEDYYEDGEKYQGIDIKVKAEEPTLIPKEETKIVSDDESSDNDNEIPAVAMVPEKKSKSRKKRIREDEDSSSEENEIPAIPNPPEKSYDSPDKQYDSPDQQYDSPDKQYDSEEKQPDSPKAQIREDNTLSDNENELPAIANSPEMESDPHKEPIQEDNSSSDGNEIAAVANSPEPSEEEAPAPVQKKRKKKKKKRVRANEIDSDD